MCVYHPRVIFPSTCNYSCHAKCLTAAAVCGCPSSADLATLRELRRQLGAVVALHTMRKRRSFSSQQGKGCPQKQFLRSHTVYFKNGRIKKCNLVFGPTSRLVPPALLSISQRILRFVAASSVNDAQRHEVCSPPFRARRGRRRD